ncbi:MAG: hypothetical protein HND43_10465 [Armatimonadetes bacterium]|jgi:hypothetical protein|nr:hypothetical protein [Armatimonadota bacterium]
MSAVTISTLDATRAPDGQSFALLFADELAVLRFYHVTIGTGAAAALAGRA